MTNGTCLCGQVTWTLTAQPFTGYNCYCAMCRKLHGTAFSTFWRLGADDLHWTGGTDAIVHYQSSHLTRGFCGHCGSSVPLMSKNHLGWAVPAGSHATGRRPDCDIFTAHTAPWFTLTGTLPRHDDYPPDTGYPALPDKPLPPQPDGIIRGGCLCGAVHFHVTEPFKMARYCHCSRCRRARSAAHASNGFTSIDGVTFTRGEDQVKAYDLPDAKVFGQAFCQTCSSPMPRRIAETGSAVVPLGSLDDDPGIRPACHIYAGDKAGWHEITDELPAYAEGPLR